MFHLSSLIFFNDKSDTGLNRGWGGGEGTEGSGEPCIPSFRPSVEVPPLRNFSIA